MITIDSLTKRYGGFTAVDDVTFTASAGRVTGFLGPNGAGKSTTMRVMVGLTPPTSGSVRVNGQLFADLPNPGLEVGVLLDASAQHAGRTGREILTIAQRTMGLPKLRVEEMLDRVSLTENEADRRVRNYSLGMRQRLGIATALIGEPGGADPRRAGQRPRPGGHPLDARPAAVLRRPGRHRAALLAPAPRDRGDRRRPRGDRQRPHRRAGHQGRAAARRRDRRPQPRTWSRWSGRWPSRASRPRRTTRTRCAPTPTPRWSAQIALQAGVPLLELHSADGAGLEEMFLELTAETQREGAAA